MKKTTRLLFLINLILIVLTSFLPVSAQNNSAQTSLNKTLHKSKQPPIFLSVHVNLQQDLVQLKWNHNKEDSTKKFIIEKRTNHNEWKELTTVNCASHKKIAINYFHVDFFPSLYLSYYRLKSIGSDGIIDYSNITPVYYNKYKGKLAGIKVYPDFSQSHKIINIAFEEVFDKELLVVIRNKKGVEYYSKVIINVEKELLVAVPIDQEIPKGVYLITATSEDEIYSQNVTIY